MNKLDVKNRLLQARQLIQKGWAQGTFDTAYIKPGDTIKYCAVGALRTMDRLWNDVTRSAGELLNDIIIDEYKYEIDEYKYESSIVPVTWWEVVSEWNDDKNRTKEEVVGLFTRAIAKVNEISFETAVNMPVLSFNEDKT